jgi:uncharacterized LabA/DUF88 family protein
MTSIKSISTYVFIDASNIIYGTRDENWKVDFKKLIKYLRQRFQAKQIYYFAGQNQGDNKQRKFYDLLISFGYILVLKPVKIFYNNGQKVRKANCDVDLTFYAMKHIKKYKRGIFLTGDGDFEILFKYLLSLKKRVVIFANSKRTAHEIKQIKGIQFNDLQVIKPIVSLQQK